MKRLIGAVLLISFFTTSLPVLAKTTPKPSPTALCKDGTYSYSKTRSGTCSHHKGVKKWYK